mmetsp:Transcript_1511/g.4104  ORF Transcript_1511/g.4104 Transcript_1511/m.4104 type:complete len:527 (+) Transcript_1511:237-1817(+)|eukprot:CAMPEP_0119132102 /NCGR_PEP_ID=MMETSP1310-20130426/11478_1 /TAXON_ID=464262 /ORGANISM="Genus nov. species nov., Strain RCC2339" /LENGTH=526 /DNA_ID=CAMNT_0007122717 /DNA_START=251 /DNA_END=1831 /DNA_ORIENTATION=+
MSRVGYSSTQKQLGKPLLEVGAEEGNLEELEIAEKKKPFFSPADVRDWWVAEGWKTVIFLLWVAANMGLIAYAGYVYWDNPNYYVTVARMGGATLNLNCALILVPVLRHSLTWLRKVRILRDIIPFDSNIRFHKMIAYAIFFAGLVHGLAHYLNYNESGSPWTLGWSTLAGATGHVLSLVCIIIGTAAVDPVRRPNYNVFYVTHHTFIIFFALLLAHGPRFWYYFIGPGVLYFLERMYREISARKLRTRVVTVTNHPSDVVELQMKKKLFRYKPGQYLFLNCPYLSQWEWHPFTISSSPEEETVGVHIRCVGDWTKGLRDLIAPPQEGTQITLYRTHGPDNKKALLRIDGPYGAASEDIFDYKVVLLVGAGIGVTPFSSILKTIYLRLKKFREGYSTKNPMKKLQKVYFYWVLREFKAFEWLRTMLIQVESELVADGFADSVEFNIHVTGKVKQDDEMGMQAGIKFGRPEWPTIFSNIRAAHNGTKVGCFFCGPKPLGHILEDNCKEYSKDYATYGVRFTWNKENF